MPIEKRNRLIAVVALALLAWTLLWQASYYMASGWLRMHVVGAYAELRQRGIVNESLESEHFDAELARDPLYLPLGPLLGDTLRTLDFHAYAMTGACVLFAIAAFVIGQKWRH